MQTYCEECVLSSDRCYYVRSRRSNAASMLWHSVCPYSTAFRVALPIIATLVHLSRKGAQVSAGEEAENGVVQCTVPRPGPVECNVPIGFGDLSKSTCLLDSSTGSMSTTLCHSLFTLPSRSFELRVALLQHHNLSLPNY